MGVAYSNVIASARNSEKLLPLCGEVEQAMSRRGMGVQLIMTVLLGPV